MSIYTITLKRELLNASEAGGEHSDRRLVGRSSEVAGSASTPLAETATASDTSPAGISPAYGSEHQLASADWLDCICGLQRRRNELEASELKGQEKEGIGEDKTKSSKVNSGEEQLNSGQHSEECLKFRLERERVLQDQADQIEHSVNVTLEVTANLKQPNRIVWYKNDKQLTSSERPVLYKTPSGQLRSLVGKRKPKGESERRKSSTKRTRSSKRQESTGNQVIKSSSIEVEEVVEIGGESGELEGLVAKWSQESSERGSRLTIHNIEEEDYGQYTCRLIDLLDGHQLNIHTQLKLDNLREGKGESDKGKRCYNIHLNAMDEVIEVKEGDLNIELGIQILPETNDDEELMSAEEKDEFIRNTSISWFKDDVRLDENDYDTNKLYTFSYDQVEGFHRLIVKKATKETEGVYTCLVENESGTSSCSTQLIVGPGNKPKLSSRLQDVTVYVGQSLEFRIKSTGLPPIDSCQWFRDEKLVVEMSSLSSETITSKHSERISMSREVDESAAATSGKEEDKIIIFRLCIDDLKLDDTGRYKCRINNEYGYDETDCFVKVLQEIIEEHEEIEETIEETMRLGGGKKSTREEEEELEETTTTVEEEEEQQQQRSVKRQRQEEEAREDVEMRDTEGRAPRFKRRLEDLTIVQEEEETITVRTSELLVSTERDKWSEKSDMKLVWLVNEREISSSDEFHTIENFYDQTEELWKHRLLINNSRGLSRRRSSLSSMSSSSNRYTCRASNKFGQDETSCVVSSMRRPKFLKRLEDVESSVGETVTLKVSLEKEEENLDELQFLKDGKLVYSSKSDGSSREFTSQSKSRVKVSAYEEQVEVEEETRSSYTRRYSRGLNQRKSARSFEIRIENVQIDQAGGWECLARNKAGESSCKADVEVFAEPKIVTDLPETQRVKPGDQIRLSVEASGSPIPVYSWFKDGIGIAEEEDRVFTQTRKRSSESGSSRRTSVTSMRTEDGVSISGETLIIKDARPEDMGEYTCKVENRLGQVKSKDCKITLVGHDTRSAPRIIRDLSQEKIHEIDEGESLILKVLAEGNPKPRQLWFKDTEEIIERVTQVELENEGQEYRLKIKRTSRSDSGSYKVLLRNELGETESKTVEVRVRVAEESELGQRRPSAPHIMLDSQDKVVGLGSNVSFDVQVGGHPKPFVTWYKNGRRLTESGDGRVSFVEEETTTTTIEEEEDLKTGEKKQTVRKETSTIHKLIIENVRESDEAIYSLKAENELGTTKSSLVSLTVDKRKEATDELEEARRAKEARTATSETVEETTSTTVETTTSSSRREEEEESEETVEDRQRRKERRKDIKTEDYEDQEQDEDEEEDEDGGRRKRTTTRTTTTKTTRTTTTTEEEEAEERARREKASREEHLQEQEEEESAKHSKRRTVEEEEEVEEEIEEETKSKRKTRTEIEEEREEETEEKLKEVKRRRDSKLESEMEVAEEEREEEEDEESRKRRTKTVKEEVTEKRSQKRESISEESRSKQERVDAELLEETSTKTEVAQVETCAPKIINLTEEIVGGPGCQAKIEVDVLANPEATVTWYKDGRPLRDYQLTPGGHLAASEGPLPIGANIVRYTLKIDKVRSTDASEYMLVATNPLGTTESQPMSVKIDRLMTPEEEPIVKHMVPPEQLQASAAKPMDGAPAEYAPQITSVAEEVVAGVGSSPVIEAVIKASPEPKTTWFKDGQPISPADANLEVIREKLADDMVKEILKINSMKPADVAAYHVQVENPLGEIESAPTNVRIDRSMRPRDEPLVTKTETPFSVEEAQESANTLQPQRAASIKKVPQKIVAGLGSSPAIEVEVEGEPNPEVTWYKDGRLLTETRGHIAIVEEPKGHHKLKITNLKAIDQGDYVLKAKNEQGEVESTPIALVVDKEMGPREAPHVIDATDEELPIQKSTSEKMMVDSFSPEITSVPAEVVAGIGSSPVIEAVIKASPEPKTTWFKDGQPISPTDYNLEVVREKVGDDAIKESLKINSMKAADVAAYHVQAENPLGAIESAPTNVRLDRSMGSRDEPVVVKSQIEASQDAEAPGKPQRAASFKKVPQKVVAGIGSSPAIEVEIAGEPKPEVAWFKDGREVAETPGHVAIVEEPEGHHKLVITNLKAADQGDYTVKATNALGEVESTPISLVVDRGMSRRDEPQVVEALEKARETEEDESGKRKSKKIEEEVVEKASKRRESIFDEKEPQREDAQLDKKPAKSEIATSVSCAPKIINETEEIVGGPGCKVKLEVDVQALPKATVTWYKDGRPLRDYQLTPGGHLVAAEGPSPIGADIVRYTLKIEKVRSTDASEYMLVATNPLGTAESKPMNIKIDRLMTPEEEPMVKHMIPPEQLEATTAEPKDGAPAEYAPQITSVAEEVVAGVGSSPVIEAVIKASPEPKTTWFKDGQPISPADANLEVIREKLADDMVKEILKINSMKPADVAAYHVQVENPLGEIESAPTNVRIDRSMRPRDEPLVTKTETPFSVEEAQESANTLQPQRAASIKKVPQKIVAGLGSSPAIEVEVEGQPNPEVTWYKDGRLVTETRGHIAIVEEPKGHHKLKITNLKAIDQGDYVVKAANELGEVESTPISLVVDKNMGPREQPQVFQIGEVPTEASLTEQLPSDGFAPRILSAPEKIVAEVGTPSEVNVEVEASPAASVCWYKDGEPIPSRLVEEGHIKLTESSTGPNAVKHTLKIDSLKPSDAATYQVQVENPFGSVKSPSVPITVRRRSSLAPGQLEEAAAQKPELPATEKAKMQAPSIRSVPKNVNAALGSNPTLEAEISAEPKPEVVWLKDGQPIRPNDSHYSVLEQPELGVYKLTINGVRSSDEAVYSVKAANELRAAESEPIDVRVDRAMKRGSVQGYAPEVLSATKELVAAPGERPVIEVVVKASPAAEVEWLKDGQPLTAAERRRLSAGEEATSEPEATKYTLKIDGLKPNDAAAYQLKARNPFGSAESQPTDVRLERSTDASQAAATTDEPSALKQEAAPVAAGGQCAPEIVSVPEEVVAGVGSSPVIEAVIKASPEAETTWFKDGQPISPADANLEVLRERLPDGQVRETLEIKKMRPADVAAYHVQAANPLGEVESAPTNVRIDRSMDSKDEPIVTSAAAMPEQEEVAPAKGDEDAKRKLAPSIKRVPGKIVAPLGSAPEIEVQVEGEPNPEVVFYKDGRLVSESRGHLAIVEGPKGHHKLCISNLKAADQGEYTVRASNDSGQTESAPIQLVVDKSMSAGEEPRVLDSAELPSGEQSFGAEQGLPESYAPQILSMPEEVVAGVGSSPVIEAVIKASPEPKTTWFKDGQPISPADANLEVIREKLPDGSVKETLRIKRMKPADVAAYHVMAENPLGELESAPTNVRIDRSMDPTDAPLVTKTETPFSPEEAEESAPKKRTFAPNIRKAPRKIVAPLGSSPEIEVQVEGEPKPEVVWLKDGRLVSEVRGHIALVELPDGSHKLCFSNLKAVDQGDYTVRATNSLGEVVSEPITVVVDNSMGARDEPQVFDSSELPLNSSAADKLPADGYAPKIVKVSDKVVAQAGQPSQIEVLVQASPEASVSWFKDGQPIPGRLIEEGHLRVTETPAGPDTTKFAIELASLKPSDAATYHLEAENPFGSVKSPAVAMTVRRRSSLAAPAAVEQEAEDKKRKMRAPAIKRIPKQVNAALGSSPTIEVEVSGEPKPEVVWFRNGVRIERNDAHFSIQDLPQLGVYRLTINEVKTSDEAVYTLKATNEAGQAESGPIELKVDASMRRGSVQGFAPEVVSSTEEVVAGAGSQPCVEVAIRASPTAKVEWFKDGQPLSSQEMRRIELSELKTDEQDTVRYVLKIKGLKPTDVAAYYLRAENPFGCVESEPSNLRIDRAMEATDAPLWSESRPAPDEDAGRRKPIRAPVIKRIPRKVVAAVGSSPVIEIEVSGEPKPEVVWYRNGKRVTEVHKHIAFEETPDGVYRLCFTNLKATDQAEYTVVATNAAGSVESGPIQLVIDSSMRAKDEPFVQQETEVPIEGTLLATEDGPIEAPRILGLDDQEALAGQTVKLKAEVLGNPKPEIKWLKDGDEVELNILNTVPDSNEHSLTLKNVNDLYDGTYSLEAKNIAGVARKDAQVKVVEKLSPKAEEQQASESFRPEAESAKRKEPEEPREKPFIRKGLKFSQVNQGRSIKFEVQVDGKYDELIWMKDGQRINLPFEGEEEEESSEAEIKPEAAADGGLESDTDTLVTGDDLAAGSPKRRFAPKIISRPRNIVAGPGSRVAFEMRASGEPKPDIHWFKNGTRIESSSDGKITIEEFEEGAVRLVIEDCQESDVGEYHLVAENAYGKERTVPVRLELDEEMAASDDLANTCASASLAPAELKRGRAPRILSRPRAVQAPKGSRVFFELQVSGEPEPIVNWFRDGRLITQTADGHVIIEEFSNGCVRLVLSDIGQSDVAQYHAVAENKLGSDRTIPVSLTLEPEGEARDDVPDFAQISSLEDEEARRKRGGRPPRILLRPKRLEADEGGEFTLEVSVVGQSRPSIVWYKDGQRIICGQSSEERVWREKVSESYEKLHVTRVSSSDAGSYSVSAENDFGTAMSESVRVSVSSETTTTSTTTTTTTTTESFFERFVDDGSSSAGVTPPDEKRKFAPRFSVRPRNKKAPLGGKVDFEVRVKGDPKPDVIWYKNGRRIQTSADGRVRVEEFSDGGSKLVIEELQETDHGVYAAEASNELGSERTEDVQLRVTQRTEVSERSESTMRGTARVTTKTRKTRSHYTFSEERHGYVTLAINDAQLEHDGDYKLVVRNKWGEASTQAPLVVIPKVEPRSAFSADRSLTTGYEDSQDGRDSRARRTPFDELEDYNHELDRSVGVFGSESRYQSGEDTYLLQLRDTEFPLRLRKYLRFGARQSPSLRSNLMDAHWGAGARVTIRERRKFREVMDEEIEDEKRGLDTRPTPMRLQKEVGTCGYAAAQLEQLRVEAAERVARKSAGVDEQPVDMMPPFFREKLKDCVVQELASGRSEPAVFACLAAGEPKPEYSWFRNDIIITPDASRMSILEREDGGSELQIRDPRIHDAGCFKCVARNVHGNVVSRARLRVAGKPSRPEPPELASVTSRELFLQWKPPRDYDVNAAETLGYRLEMSESSIGQQESWSVLAADIPHEYYIVDDLSPSTSYSFRLSARNKFGWSESSYSCYVTTCRSDDEHSGRLQVPHEMRSRQYTSDICDVHLLRSCEEQKRPRMNYQLESNPVKMNGAEGDERWQDALQLQAEIARGRFSVISKAVRKSSSSAAETAPPDESSLVVKAVLVDSMQAAQTKNEFDILRSLQHEKVVKLQMAYRDEQMFVLVMERLSGIDVLTYLSSFTSYNEETVSKIIVQVMDAIEYLHFRGMCMLELLPDNVVMTNGRTTALKLVDFSSARFVPKSGARVPLNPSQMIEYCPPEVIAGHEVSTASDVWCIGVLTYVLLSGHSPFKGDSGQEEETRENVRLGRYKYDHIYNNCTPEVTRFLINVFKKHSSKRPTIEQLYDNKWLLPNEFMIRKRQQAIFKTDKIVAFAEEFHKFKLSQAQCPQELLDLMASN